MKNDCIFCAIAAGEIPSFKVYEDDLVLAYLDINPLIGATGLSAVPMASRVANEIALQYDPKNHVLQYCMASNISGVIGSAVVAGILYTLCR